MRQLGDKLDIGEFVAIHRQAKGIGSSLTVRFLMLYATGVVAIQTDWMPNTAEGIKHGVELLLRLAAQRGQKLKLVPVSRDSADPHAPLIYMLEPAPKD